MRILPVRGNVRVLLIWAGSYHMTPDTHPIVGPMPGVEGFFRSAGFSGHGFMMAPIVGKAMAEIVVGEPASVDITALQAERFTSGYQLVETMVY